MLEKIIERQQRNYAIEALRRLEYMNFKTKELAQEYFNITYDVLRRDLHGINVEPTYRETQTVVVEGKNIGKRYMVWTVSISMERIVVEKL